MMMKPAWGMVAVFDENGEIPEGIWITDTDGNTWAMRTEGIATTGDVPQETFEKLVRQLKMIRIIET